MHDMNMAVESLDIRRVRRETVSRRQQAVRRRQIMRGLVVGLAVFATFMLAVAVGVAAST